VLLVFVRFQPGTLIIRSWVLSVLLLSVGFFVSGIGPTLPVWATVIGTNIALLSSGPIIYSGFSAFFKRRQSMPNLWGWIIVALTVPAFCYWGLIEPNGIYRSMVFSLAAAAINFPTALLFGRNAVQRRCDIPTRVMAALFSVLTAWMTVRFTVLLLSAPPPPELRGANPTSWITVFGYIILMSLMTVCVMWMEANRLKERSVEITQNAGRLSVFVDYFRNKLLLLWSAVTVLIVSVVSMLGIGYLNIRYSEKERMIRTAELANDAFVEHTIQITGQVETSLNAVRNFYKRTNSLPETETFIKNLGFDRSVIDNIYLIAADGRIVIAHDPKAIGRSVSDRDYFTFHRSNSIDRMFIASVEPGRVTGKHHFRITHRISNPDSSFGGIVLVAVNPEAFTHYYGRLMTGTQNIASLLSTDDRKLRARIPDPSPDRWSQPVDSPIWEMLQKRPSGLYENTSKVDSIRRIYVFKKIGELPLVMVTGFSNHELRHGIRERMSWLVITSVTILLFTLLLALLLSNEARRREEHARSETALRKNDLRLREAQAVAKIGDWDFDPETGMLGYSDQMYELLGLAPGSGSLHISEVMPFFHPDDAPEVEQYFRRALEEGTGWQHDGRVILSDGRIVWHRVTGKTLVDTQGKVVKVYGTTQDITRDKVMESELKILNETLQKRVEEETNRRMSNERLLLQRSRQADMGEMIGAIAHQWRQPLSTVSVIFQNLLAARRMNRLDEAYLEKAATDATAMITHMSKTIDSFRNFFKPEKNKENFKVLKKIEEALGFIDGQFKSLGITVTMAEDIDANSIINGFPNEFSQVILNLLANARDAILDKRSANGDETSRVAISSLVKGGCLVIEITDSGCGIPPEAASRVFEPYFTTKEESQGTGVGLYMSRQIIEESMGGTLTFTSRPGETVFRIELPIA